MTSGGGTRGSLGSLLGVMAIFLFAVFPDPETGQLTTPAAVVIVVLMTGGKGATPQQLVVTGVVFASAVALYMLGRALFGKRTSY